MYTKLPGSEGIEGTITALVTPFSEDASEVDFNSFEKLIEFQIEEKVDGIVVCGSTGEAATLTDEEYKNVVARAKKIIGNRTRLLAGIGTNSTAKALEITRFLNEQLKAADGDIIMVVAPPYNKPSQEGIIRHIEEVKKESRLPIMAYNVPGRTGVNILPSTIHALSQKGTIIAVKEASGSVDQIMDAVTAAGAKANVLSGDDALTLPTMACGTKGIVSVVSNVEPRLVKAITQNALLGKWDDAKEAHYQMLPLCRALFMESNPVPVKAAAHIRGLIKHESVRLPLITAGDKTKEKLRTLLLK